MDALGTKECAARSVQQCSLAIEACDGAVVHGILQEAEQRCRELLVWRVQLSVRILGSRDCFLEELEAACGSTPSARFVVAILLTHRAVVARAFPSAYLPNCSRSTHRRLYGRPDRRPLLSNTRASGREPQFSRSSCDVSVTAAIATLEGRLASISAASDAAEEPDVLA
jgi:hypothetical protein